MFIMSEVAVQLFQESPIAFGKVRGVANNISHLFFSLSHFFRQLRRFLATFTTLLFLLRVSSSAFRTGRGETLVPRARGLHPPNARTAYNVADHLPALECFS